MIGSLIILGGGNAGLMSALMIKTAFPRLSISIIKSDKIGTVGVGEGSNEHWLEFAKLVGITTEDVVREADATFKHGIKFEGWLNGTDTYFHSLPEFLCVQDNCSGIPLSLLSSIAKNFPADRLVWEESVKGLIAFPIDYDFAQFHFNTFKLNVYLERLCNEKGISLYEDTVHDIILDDRGYVDKIIGEKSSYSAEFFIDSSGFSRIISKKLELTWHSYQKYLPTDSAIAFPTAKTQDPTPTFTLAKARKNGWSWRSPVYDRYGNGYVFSSEFTNVQLAVEEIQKDYDQPINVAKDIKFTSGKISEFWCKNCLNIGLSGSFIEPLEASNIGTTINQIKAFLTHIVTWVPGDFTNPRRYNKLFDQVSENILDFVQLHYISKREDTEFWKWCKYEMPLTDFNKETLEHFKKNFVNYNFFHNNQYELFDELDWIQVMHGLEMFDISSLREKYINTGFLDYQPRCDVSGFIKHDDLIKQLKGF